MRRKHNPLLTEHARELRRKMTAEERRLWFEFLRYYPIKFQRQKILGKYIVDFYCHKARVIIELDGSQHYTDAAIEADTERTQFLEGYGIKVIRLQNTEINSNFANVCDHIDELVQQRISLLSK